MGREQPRNIKTTLTYCVDDGTMPVNETKDMITKMPSYSGNFDEHIVTIKNARQIPQHLNLEVNGFELVKHNSQVKDFINKEELTNTYYPEIKALVTKHTTASKVVIFDHTVRTGDDKKRETMLLREPVRRVHNDYTEWSGPQRVRDIMLEEAEDFLQKRFGKVVKIPVPACRNNVCGARPHFLFQLTQGGFFRRLAGFDSPLWHLPCVARHVDATADKDLAFRI